MAKEFITNGGAIIQKDNFGNYKVNGQQASRQDVQATIQNFGGNVQELRYADKNTQKFAEMQKQAIRQEGRDI